MMNLKPIFCIAFLLCPAVVFATNVDEWVFKEVTGDLKPSPGCLEKQKAMDKVMKKPETYKGYSRFDKYSKLLCEQEGYGWTRAEVLDEGEVVCDECGGDYADKYRCYMKNVKLKCKQVVR